METQEMILLTAVDQFNQSGTAKITTNHIAKEAGISPGNLYYHYKDKAHIIREIYEMMMRDWEKAYAQIEETALLPENLLKDFIQVNFELLWRYRFFYREMVALMNSDPLLARRHIEVTRTRFARQRAILQKAVDQGVMHLPDPDVQLDDLLTIAWIVANHYLIYQESMGQTVEKKDFKAGAELVMKVLRPYMQ